MDVINFLAAKSDINCPTKYLSFEIHSEDTARMICKLYDRWLPQHAKEITSKHICGYENYEEDKTREFLKLLAYLHDIGKLTPAFQFKISNSIENYSDLLSKSDLELGNISEYLKTPHALAGKCILEMHGFPKEISNIIGSHHGKGEMTFSDDHVRTFPSNFYGQHKKKKEEWESIWKKWIDYSLERTGFILGDLPQPDIDAQMILTGLLIMADWIASNTYYFPYLEIGQLLNEKECNERSKIAWERLGLPKIMEIDQCCDNPLIFKERFGFAPNDVQREIMDIVSHNNTCGIYIIEAPMGVGKTEAALAAAEILIEKLGQGGIYFGLPTQATANGIFGRISEWAQGCDSEMHSIRLAHGMTDLNEEYQSLFHGIATDPDDGNLVVHSWFEGRKQAMLSDFVIATVDQFLLASLKQKHVMLRHLGLSGKVVVIDECHAYDAYMNVYLDSTLKWMKEYEVPVIILSATLPPERRKELVKAYCGSKVLKNNIEVLSTNEYPVITYAGIEGVKRKKLGNDFSDKMIKVNRITEESLHSYLKDKLDDDGCASVIVNSVVYAQRIAKILREHLPDYEIICFHSRFIATDRARIEKNLLQRLGKQSTMKDRRKLIVVGTQVLEQSLDLDFDVMVTELCPMDLLLQRIGRLQRHQRTDRPDKCKEAEVAIMDQENPIRSVYPDWILQQTQENIPEVFLIPSCIPKLVSRVYDKPKEETEEYKTYTDTIREKKRKANKYCMNLADAMYIPELVNNDVENSERAEAAVRDTEESIEVIVLKRISEKMLATVSDRCRFDTTTELNDEEVLNVARERLRLPYVFGKGENWDDTYRELECMPLRWRSSSMISKELLLVLDNDLETELIGKRLRYSKEYGLEMVNEEEG